MSAVWCQDDTTLDDLIFLGKETLVVDSPDTDKVPQIRDALLNGATPASVLGSDAVNIPLVAVTRISVDKHVENIDISYKEGKETEETTLYLASIEKRDEVLGALQAAFGDRFERFEETWSVPQAAFSPLSWFTGFAAFTWIFSQAAADIRERGLEDIEISGDDEGTKGLFVWVLDLLGPTGVTVIGGTICALFAIAVVLGVRKPPVMVILQEPPFKAQSSVVLISKYAILAVVWYFAARIALS